MWYITDSYVPTNQCLVSTLPSNTTFLLDNAVWPMDDERAVSSVSKVWPEESSRILKPSMGKVNLQHYAIPCFYCCSFDHDIAQSQNAEVQMGRPPCRRPCRYEMGGMKSGIFRVRRRYGVDPSYRMHSCSRHGLSGHAPKFGGRSTVQLQGIHERLVFVLPRSLFCLRAALSCLLELEDFAASQPCINVFLGHS